MKKNIRVMAVIVFFILFILYGAFETIKVFSGPSLIITIPKNLDTVYEPLLTVSGIVKRVSYITINDRQIFADTNGNFYEKLLLLPGYNIIKVDVKDRFGKEVKKDIEIWFADK